MKKAFVIIDYQNDFIDGSLGFEKAKKLEHRILEKLQNLDYEKQDLLFTFDTHDENYLLSKEGLNLPFKHCIKDTQGWQMPQGFEPFLKKAKKIFYKNTFGSLEFANFLSTQNYDEIEFCGLVSHICVFHNLILAYNALPNVSLVLYKELSASFDESLEQKAFDLLESFNVKII